MPERGIETSSEEHGEIESWVVNDINALGWELFVDPPQKAYVEFVFKFLTTMAKEDLPVVKIKGVEVSFAPSEINEHFNTISVPLEEDEYERYYKRRTDQEAIDEILAAVCNEGAKWGIGESLSRKSLKFEANVWMHFINARLIPGSHDSRVNRERSILVFCTLTKKKFDVGRIIYNQLESSLGKGGTFYFPCLVTEMCMRAKLEPSNTKVKETIAWDSSIDQGTIKRIRKNEGLENEEVDEEEEPEKKAEGEKGVVKEEGEGRTEGPESSQKLAMEEQQPTKTA